MSPRRLALASIVVLALGVGLAAHATLRLRELERTSAALARAGREAGDSFARTLRGEHAARQFKAFDDRRAVALERAAARRNRLLAVLLVVAGAIGLATAAALRRMAREIEEARRQAEEADDAAEAADGRPPPTG
jgi:hypothetical protein